MAELKPCPFCGGSNLRVTDSCGYLEMSVECADCDASGPYGWPDDRESAVEQWNKRVKCN